MTLRQSHVGLISSLHRDVPVDRWCRLFDFWFDCCITFRHVTFLYSTIFRFQCVGLRYAKTGDARWCCFLGQGGGDGMRVHGFGTPLTAEDDGQACWTLLPSSIN